MRAFLLLKKNWGKLVHESKCLRSTELPDHCPKTVMEKGVIASDFGAMHIEHSLVGDD